MREVAATNHYNAANVMTGYKQRSISCCIKHYRRAVQLDPTYLERAYWWREIAGVFFEIGRFSAAAGCYEKALSLGETGEVLALKAEAQLNAGFYAEASNTFKLYFRHLKQTNDGSTGNKYEQGSGVWCLYDWCLDSVIDVLGISKGPSSRKKHLYTGKLDDLDSLFRHLQKYGLLQSNLWFNCGAALVKEGEMHGAQICYLMEALINPSDIEAQGNALGLAMNSNDVNLMAHIFDFALFTHGNSFIDYYVDTHVPNDGTDECNNAKLQLRKAFLVGHSEIYDQKKQLEVRLPSDIRSSDTRSLKAGEA